MKRGSRDRIDDRRQIRTVTELGDVADAVVIEGNTLFHGAVLEAIRTWKFKPASLFGKAVRFTKLVSIPFRLRE